MKKWILAAAFLLLAAQPAAAKVVTAEGTGLDRDGALRAAQRNAVEQVVGTLIDARTVVRNAQIELDEIYTRSQGFIARTDVLSEGVQTDGSYKIVARFDVDTSPGAELAKRLHALSSPSMPRVAVLPFNIKAAVSHDLDFSYNESVSEEVAFALTNENCFDILERGEIARVIDEQRLQTSGAAAQAGKVLGADYILVGSITGLSSKKMVNEALGFGNKQSQVIAHVTGRLIEVKTGRVVLAGRGTGKATNTLTKAPLRIVRFGTAELDGEQVTLALQKAADDLVSGKTGLMARLKKKI